MVTAQQLAAQAFQGKDLPEVQVQTLRLLLPAAVAVLGL
jgi:hypothetical protein